jgi:transposase
VIYFDMAEAYGPAPPINLPTHLPQITRYCLSAGRTADLARDTQFVNARYRAHQMVRLMELSSTELHLNPSVRSVARPFNITHCAVKRALLRGYEDPPWRGRHRELSPEDEHALVEWIAKKAHDNTAITQTELLNYCIATFGTAVTKGWVDSFLSRHAGELFETKRSPQENQRLDVPRVFLKAAIEGIRTHVQNVCVDLVFNLDKIRISEWEDRAKEK